MKKSPKRSGARRTVCKTGNQVSPSTGWAWASPLAARLFSPEGVVCLAVLASYLLVYPVGEYAILDDWAFVRSLQILHDEGRLEILDWNPMALVGHLGWGGLFTKLFG